MIITSILTVLASLTVALITSLTTFRAQKQRLRTELRTEFMAEEAMKQLLNISRWPTRSFEAIRRRVGGFEDDELRKLLVRAGAVRFYQVGTGKELWGLRERNKDDLEEDELDKDEL